MGGLSLLFRQYLSAFSNPILLSLIGQFYAIPKIQCEWSGLSSAMDACTWSCLQSEGLQDAEWEEADDIDAILLCRGKQGFHITWGSPIGSSLSFNCGSIQITNVTLK